MQSLYVLIQLLQSEIASPQSRLYTAWGLTSWKPGADRLAKCATALLGAVATVRNGLYTNSFVCLGDVRYKVRACVCMSSFLHPARLTNANMWLGNGYHRIQLLGADYRLGALRLEDGLRAGGVRWPHRTARRTW